MAAAPKDKLSVKEMLPLLLKVQEYDSQLLELEMRKSFFPDLVKQLKQEIESFQEHYNKSHSRLMDIKRDMAMLELELQTAKDSFENSQARLMKVTTNREYDAVQIEILTHQEKAAELEQKIIVLMDEQESLEKDVSETSEKLNSAKERNTTRIVEIEHNASEIDNIIGGIQASREQYASQVSGTIIRRYNQIRGGKQGVAVVPVVERACGGCRQALPPQRIQEVRAGQMVICENCGRIIVDIEQMSPRAKGK